MTIRWHCLPFEALPPLILYDLLRLRCEVFVVEQKCAYQDVDRRDLDALHLLGHNDDGELVAFARLFDAGKCYAQVSIGRVLVAPAYRRYSLGRELMNQALAHCTALFGSQPVAIGAQLYLERFYASFGFEQVGEAYEEDGIAHIHMLRT